MLDINFIKNNQQYVEQALAKKNWKADLTETIQKYSKKNKNSC